MDLFRWRRLLSRAIGPAAACALLAGWGVYVLTADERPSYASEALLSTGIMSGTDKSAYVRDLVINELEGIQNLARAFETREELATRLLATYLSLDGPDPAVISERAYGDLAAELAELEAEAGIQVFARHRARATPARIYESLVAERDSLLRYGEANAGHPLVEIVYGDNELVGLEQLSTLAVGRRGMSDLLELSYSTVDAAWCKRTLDTHIDIFLAAHAAVEAERSGGALAYLRGATDEARATLQRAEERHRAFAAEHRIINYYEQTRAIATQRKELDQSHVDQLMKRAAADEALASLEDRLADRVNLRRLNDAVDARRRAITGLSREQARLQIMTPDSARADVQPALAEVSTELAREREALREEVSQLQNVYTGPEGVQLSRLLDEWIAAVLAQEESRGRIAVIEQTQRDFDAMFRTLASRGATLKKIEREVSIAEEDYLETLRGLNLAMQKEHEESSSADLRLVDAPILPTAPEASKRLLLVAAAGIVGGMFPLVLAITLELVSGGLTSFAEAEKRSGLSVVGGVARWSWLRRASRKRSERVLADTTADLVWQGIRSRADLGKGPPGSPMLLAVSSLQPGAGKTYVVDTLAQRLAARGFGVGVVTDEPGRIGAAAGLRVLTADTLSVRAERAAPRDVCGLRQNEWDALQVVLWELPAVATGRLPVAIVREADAVLLVHAPNHGWGDGHATATDLLREASGGRAPLLVLNGVPADVLLHEWGAGWRQLRRWARGAGAVPDATPDVVPDGGGAGGREPTKRAPGRPDEALSWPPLVAELRDSPEDVPTPSEVPPSWEDSLL